MMDLIFGSGIFLAGSGFTSYHAIIGASLIVLLSYSFDFIAKKVGIPSVILLIGLGIGIAYGLKSVGNEMTEGIIPVLEILGTIGLILIVLEAALDLELQKEKQSLIIKSFVVALFILLLTSFFVAAILVGILNEDWLTSFIYAVPLCIMSSAIIIPSVGGLIDKKKEFMIYEATFSDILGIILFFFLTQLDLESTTMGAAVMNQLGTILLTIVISVVASYALVYFISKIIKKANFFTIFAMLSIFYAGGKMLHLSSLIMILTFGLILRNPNIFFRGWLANLIDLKTYNRILEDFTLLTHQSAFLVRTFFFVVFGMIIDLSVVTDMNVLLVSLSIIGVIYLVRFVNLRAILNTSILPELFIAPRGLITVLLFFAIPEKYQLVNFNDGIMFEVIILSALIMMVALMLAKKKYTVIEDKAVVDETSALYGFGRDTDAE